MIAFSAPMRALAVFLFAGPLAGCAALGSEVEDHLVDVNYAVRDTLGREAPCTQHAAAVERALAKRADLAVAPIYTCPAAVRGLGQCHISTAVTASDGTRYVVDNGAVVNDNVGWGGVATLEDFSQAVNGVYWIGTIPSVEDIARRIPGFKPNRAYFAASD